MADDTSLARRTLFKSPDKGGTQNNPNNISPTREGRTEIHSTMQVDKNKSPTSEGITDRPQIEKTKPPTSEGNTDRHSTMLVEKTKSPTCGGPKEKSPPKPGENRKSPEKTTSGDSPSNQWKSPPSIVNDVAEFVRNCHNYAHLVKKGGIMVDEVELKSIEKKMVSIFVIDRKINKIVRSTKDIVMKSLAGMGIKIEQIIKGNGFAMWDILLASEEECLALTKRDLHTKDHILRVVYLGRRRTRVTVFEVPRYVNGETVGAFLLTYGDIVGVSPDYRRGEWRFELMLDIEAFNSIPNCMDIGDKRQVPIIVSGRKPVCWMCGQSGHLAAICKGKKTLEDLVAPTQNALPPNESVELPTGAKRNARSTVGAHLKPPSSRPAVTSPKKDRTQAENTTEDWQTVGKGGRKVHTAGPRVPHSPHPENTDRPKGEAPQSYAEKLKNKGSCASPGKAKFDAARALLAKLNTHPAEGNTSSTIRPPQKITSPEEIAPAQTCTPPKSKQTSTASPKTLKSPPIKISPLPKTSPTRLPVTESATPHTDTQPPPLPTQLPMPPLPFHSQHSRSPHLRDTEVLQ